MHFVKPNTNKLLFILEPFTTFDTAINLVDSLLMGSKITGNIDNVDNKEDIDNIKNISSCNTKITRFIIT